MNCFTRVYIYIFLYTYFFFYSVEIYLYCLLALYVVYSISHLSPSCIDWLLSQCTLFSVSCSSNSICALL